MAGNFGMGLGSFLSGAVQGAQAYAGIQESLSRKKLRDIQVKDAENQFAEKTRMQDLEADSNRLGKIGLEQAQLQYGDDVKKVIDHYNTNTVPKLQQFWLENGQVEKAEVLGKFLETKQAKQLTENSALAIRQASMGDYTNLGPTIENLLSTSAQITGGGAYKLKGMTELTDDKGNKTGGVSFAFTGADGKDQNISFNSTSELISFIRNNAMPDKIVEYAYDQEQNAQKIRAETAKEGREWNRKVAEKRLDYGLDIGRDNNRNKNAMSLNRQQQQYALQRTQYEAEVKRAYGLDSSSPEGNKKVNEAMAAADYLRAYGYSEDEIRAQIPALLGIQNNSKNPTVRIEETIKTLANSDPMFGRLSPQEQVKRARELIDTIDRGGAQGGASSGDPYMQGNELVYPSLSGGEVSNPFQGGNAQYYIDQKTGQVVYR